MASLLIAGCMNRGRSPTNEPVPSDIFAAIFDDATGRMDIPRSEIDTQAAAGVTWSDASLGCPEPGVEYEQTDVPGYRVTLSPRSNWDDYYDYHADRDGNFILCPKGRAQDGVYPP